MDTKKVDRPLFARPLVAAPLALILLFAGCTQAPPPPPTIGIMKFPEGSVQHAVHAEAIQWKPCPGNLPSGCEMAVLEGNPQEADLFTLRFRLNQDFFMPAHSHPKDERVTILQGKAYVAFGEDGTRENAKGFGPGDYYVNAREAIHQVWADSSTILQITGIGPWEAHFVGEESQ